MFSCFAAARIGGLQLPAAFFSGTGSQRRQSLAHAFSRAVLMMACARNSEGRHDQRDLNGCDGDGEYKCPEWFTGSKGDHLSVINGSENGCD